MQWRDIQRTNFTSLDKLAEFLELSAEQKNQLIQRPDFVLNLPHRLGSKMAKGTLDDPIGLQFLPLIEENKILPGFGPDPVKESAFRPLPRLLQKYEGRALLVTTSACAMHCRFCFRRHFPYEQQPKSFEAELAALREDSSIEEVLLSGGDPLSLGNDALGGLIAAIGDIPHIKRLRFHTRFPIGIPERIDEGFLAILCKSRLSIYFVLHVNHARELDSEILAALKTIQVLGIPVLSQTVLLKQVNDTVDALVDLMNILINHQILPYYLHQLDRVQGGHHFEVSETEGLEIMAGLQQRLPGYAIPRYVREVAGEPNKMPISSL